MRFNTGKERQIERLIPNKAGSIGVAIATQPTEQLQLGGDRVDKFIETIPFAANQGL